MNSKNLPVEWNKRDFPTPFDIAELESEEIVGEDSGDVWTKFVLARAHQHITIKNEDLIDPYEYR